MKTIVPIYNSNLLKDKILMKTKIGLPLMIAFPLLLAQLSSNAQCSVKLVGDTKVGGIMRAKTGSCNVEALMWQMNGQTVYTSLKQEFQRRAETVAGGNGSGILNNQLSAPDDVSVDPAGNVYVLDSYNNRVQKWSPGSTQAVTVAGGNGLGSAANQLFLPHGFFVDASGNIYIADLFNNRIQKWAPGATTGVTVAGGHGYGSAANQLASPNDVFVDATGNIYVTDGDNNRVQKWAPGATTGVTVAGGNGYGTADNQFRTPFSIYVDAAGNIYVSDRVNNRIQKWAPGAVKGVTVAAGVNGDDSTELNDPRGLYVDTFGRVYISDYFNSRIQKWVNGMSFGITVAGGLGVGHAPGRLFNPSGVFVNNNGDLYVADEGNNRVQKFTRYDYIKDKFTPTVAGVYRVISVCADGSTDTSKEVTVTDDGLKAVQNNFVIANTNDKVLVYPNPAVEFTTIKFNASKQEKYIIQVTDISGKVVLKKDYVSVAGDNLEKINVQGLASGSYFITIRSASGSVFTAKLIKSE